VLLECISLVMQTSNLIISDSRQKLRNPVHIVLGKELLFPMQQYFLSSIKTLGGNLSDRQTSIMGSESYKKYYTPECNMCADGTTLEGLSRAGALRPQIVNKLRSFKIYFSRSKAFEKSKYLSTVSKVRGGPTLPPDEKGETIGG